MRGWGAAAAACLAVLALFAGSSKAASQTLLVDDDGLQCPTALYGDIDSAVADASGGDTITVCPGTYDPATITKRLVLRGFTPDLSKPSACASTGADDDDVDTVVTGLDVQADNVAIIGFTVTGASEGVHVPGSVNAVGISRSVIEGNSIGINLNGFSVSAARNCIRDNDTGIYSDQGLVYGTIVQNAFRTNGDAAITLVGDGAGSTANVLVDGNSSFGDGDLISLSGVTDSTISGNTVTEAVGSGVYVEDGNSGITISKNTLETGEDEGIAFDAHALVPSADVAVTKNKITDGATANADGGIEIYTDSLDDSTFSGNKVAGNGYDGMYVHAGNDGNLFEKNTFKGNRVLDASAYDCFDDPGNANTWKNDTGKNENRAGLCKGAKIT